MEAARMARVNSNCTSASRPKMRSPSIRRVVRRAIASAAGGRGCSRDLRDGGPRRNRGHGFACFRTPGTGAASGRRPGRHRSMAPFLAAVRRTISVGTGSPGWRLGAAPGEAHRLLVPGQLAARSLFAFLQLTSHGDEIFDAARCPRGSVVQTVRSERLQDWWRDGDRLSVSAGATPMTALSSILCARKLLRRRHSMSSRSLSAVFTRSRAKSNT